jgi:cytochrome c oxidase subunit IV
MATTAHADPNAGKREIKRVTIILTVFTIIELVIGYGMYLWVSEPGFLRNFLKGVIIIFMLAKAFYITAYFMHLGHELKNMIMTIVVPLGLFIWFIIAFLYDGNSYLQLRKTYDPFYKEVRTKQKGVGHEKADHGVKEKGAEHPPTQGPGHDEKK